MKKLRLKEVMSFVPNDTAMEWQGVDSNPGARPPEPPFLPLCVPWALNTGQARYGQCPTEGTAA